MNKTEVDQLLEKIYIECIHVSSSSSLLTNNAYLNYNKAISFDLMFNHKMNTI